ncbi:hypothetical protein V6N11_035731 [Hibiscus sabdariffa]|uniref:RNase H type-1 domain-containing protein n=1 Tax=Hibiscus sabdariffa TaxID=183260 RepID=A0ABR2R8T1_9ROSI
MGGVGRGKQLEGNIQAGPRGGGRGQQGSVAQIRPRGPKRGLQGKYEVCTPVGSKKARSASSILVIEEDGNLELKGLHTTESAEACAFKEGVRMAIENDWTQVIFEGDSATTVSKLDRKELERSHTAAHLRSTISKLVDQPGFSFSFVRRACNQAAHGLAQWAVNEDVIFRFDFAIPLCIKHFVIEDAIFG